MPVSEAHVTVATRFSIIKKWQMKSKREHLPTVRIKEFSHEQKEVQWIGDTYNSRSERGHANGEIN